MDGFQYSGTIEEPRIGRSTAGWNRPRLLRKLMLSLGAVVVLAGAGLYGRYYWDTGRFMVDTDDATIQADSLLISPKVSGYIAEVLVQDNQPVKTGQVL